MNAEMMERAMASNNDERGKRQRPVRAALMIGGKPYVGRTHAATGYVSSWVRRSSDLLCDIEVIQQDQGLSRVPIHAPDRNGTEVNRV